VARQLDWALDCGTACDVPPCLIGIEAGMARHYVARQLLAFGHDVRQVPPAYAKPFRQGHKNDFREAHAIAEAVQRPSTHCVQVKTNAQLELQALHRVRSRLIGGRTTVINQIRSFLDPVSKDALIKGLAHVRVLGGDKIRKDCGRNAARPV
jgi:transposase